MRKSIFGGHLSDHSPGQVVHPLLVTGVLELVVESVEGGTIRRLSLTQLPGQVKALVPQTLQAAEAHLLLALLGVTSDPHAGPPVRVAAVMHHGVFGVAVFRQHGTVTLCQELQRVHRLPDDVAVQVHAQLALPLALLAAIVVLVVLVFPGAVGGVAVHLGLGHGLVGSILCDLAEVEERLGDQLVVVLVLLAGADGAAVVVVVVLLNWNEL